MEFFPNYDRMLEPPDDDHTAECYGCGDVQDIDDMFEKRSGWLCRECWDNAPEPAPDEDE